MGYFGLLLGTLMVVLISRLWSVLVYLIWRPYVITKRFRQQRLQGPAYKFWYGSTKEIRSMKKVAREQVLDINSHDIIPKLLPHYCEWMLQYGEMFLYWLGPQPKICISNPELAKQVLSDKFGFFIKMTASPNELALFGKGSLALVEGSDWARHRRVLSRAFTMDKLEMMTEKMAYCAQSMLKGWQDQTIQAEGRQKETEVNSYFIGLTADIIAHTAFGSSYAEGKEVFMAQRELQMLVAATRFNVNIPGHNYLPTRRNIKVWKLKRRVSNTLMHIIQRRLDSKVSGFGNDLLGMMLESSTLEPGLMQEGQTLNIDEIMDECKTFFFAGHETTAHLLTWTMFLLSINQEWQERLREEVLRECRTEIPEAAVLGKLKLVNMVLLEALRLYPPVVMIRRKAAKDMNLGSIVIPKDTLLAIPTAMMHRDKDIWGADADDFNPLRFENGVSKAAKHPNAWLPFSIGPRVCIGRNFTMLEAKIVIAMILQRFSFSLSAGYIHAPIDIITLQPQHGLPLVLRSLGI